MRRPRIIAIAASASALVVTATLALGIGPAAGAGHGSIHLQARQDLGLTVIPCPDCTLEPMGFEVGDHIGEFLINHGVLVNETGRTVGHFAAHLLGTTVAVGGPPEVQLTITMSLEGGQITAQGLEEPPTDGGTIAVTGGTGRYRAAKGEMEFHDTDEATTDITLILR